MIPRVRTDGFVRGEHLTQKGAFVLDTRFHDIPNTVAGMIRALPNNCIAVSLRKQGGRAMVERAKTEARERNIRIIWLK